jgi:peptidoglycan/xylan/chitin deacetylase (PgdA/CDA1 family)
MTSYPAKPAFLARRALLTLGMAAMLPGCATTPALGRAGTTPAPAEPSPDPAATDRPRICPTDPEVLAKPGNPLQYLPCDDMNIALTIDDGPHPTWTPKILAVLARHDIQATFCVVGENAAAHPDLIAAVIDGGHQIANHTFSHPMNFAAQRPARIRAQIERATEAILAGGGNQPTLFRAPGGTWSDSVIAACESAGLRPLDWSVDTRDWALPGVDDIVRIILAKTKPGAIILDHDGGGNRAQTVDALAIALPRLLDAGYHFTSP